MNGAFVTSLPVPAKGVTTRSSTTATPAPVMVAGKTIGESIRENINYSTLQSLLNATGLDIDAAGGGTLFAPTNKAFDAMRPGLLDEIIANPNGVASQVLLRHLLPETLTVADLKKKGSGFWYSVPGGPLAFEAGGMARVKVGNATVSPSVVEDVCDNGVIHTLDGVITDLPRTMFDPLAFEQRNVSTAPVPPQSDAVTVATPSSVRSRDAAASVATVGGRRAMGLMKQLPFWMYGPPFNAAKQEEFEPISIAQPSPGTGVDYQLMPPGSVVVTPDEVSANKLNPISGMSKYIGKTQRLVEGDALSDYSKLDKLN